VGRDDGGDARRGPLGGWRLRLLAVGLPALLAGSFEFVRHGLQAFAGLSDAAGNLITAGLALVGGLAYFHAVSALLARLSAEAEQASAERLVFSQRQAIADELHDSISQTLFFLHVRLRRLLERIQQGGAAPAGWLAREMAEAVSATEDAYLEVRHTIRRLQEAGQGEAQRDRGTDVLDRLVSGILDGSDVHVEVEADGGPPRSLEPQRWAAVQSILLEALRNVRKHSHASRVRVWLRERPGGGAAGVEDDGRGFDPRATGGFGLDAMRRRAAQAGLDLHVDSAPGQGTRVRVDWRDEGATAVGTVPGPRGG
jgi:signal transduction histidine kinase